MTTSTLDELRKQAVITDWIDAYGQAQEDTMVPLSAAETAIAAAFLAGRKAERAAVLEIISDVISAVFNEPRLASEYAMLESIERRIRQREDDNG